MQAAKHNKKKHKTPRKRSTRFQMHLELWGYLQLLAKPRSPRPLAPPSVAGARPLPPAATPVELGGGVGGQVRARI